MVYELTLGKGSSLELSRARRSAPRAFAGSAWLCDQAQLSEGWKRYVRSSTPSAAIFLPAAFFFSVLSPHATMANEFIYLAYVGAIVLMVGLLALGAGLIRRA